ncbi:O-methyltransferase [Georgenia sp. AZ-5]|uniref:O-methyltransferase n=1 Tax=Georgenia sp. AZ-5 TaxID=3367526 RepID=UPI0037548883
MQGYVEGITDDRMQVWGWAKLAKEGSRPELLARLDHGRVGSFTFGPSRKDVEEVARLGTCTFVLALREPLPELALLSGDFEIVLLENGGETLLPLSANCVGRERHRLIDKVASMTPGQREAADGPAQFITAPAGLAGDGATIGDLMGLEARVNRAIADVPDQVAKAMKRALDRAVHQLIVEGIRQTRQVESLLQLVKRVPSGAPLMPTTGGFAVDARSLLHLIATVEEYRPAKVLELGSGTSTIWLGHILKEYDARLISVDHDEKYFGLTRAEVERHHLEDTVELRYAPLTQIVVRGEEYGWYDPSQLADLEGVGLVIVDGPPAETSRHVRYPALDLVRGHLVNGALVLLHDADRQPEQEIVARWMSEDPGLLPMDEGISNFAVFRHEDSVGGQAGGAQS